MLLDDGTHSPIHEYARVKDQPGVIFFVDSFATKVVEVDPDLDMQDGWDWVPEFEEVEDRTRVNAHMVGDDRPFVFDIEDIKVLPEEDHVCSCGQEGCGW